MSERGTADRVAAAALAILLAEGADAVTMRRVAADAGVTTMASYRHFASREVLLRTVADRAAAELGEKWSRRAGEPDFRRRLYGLLDDFLDFALGKPNLYTFLITDRRDDARRYPDDFRAGGSPAFTPVVDAVAQGIRDGVLRADDPLETTLAITACAMGLVQQYLGGRIGLSEPHFRALVRRTIERVLNGLRG